MKLSKILNLFKKSENNFNDFEVFYIHPEIGEILLSKDKLAEIPVHNKVLTRLSFTLLKYAGVPELCIPAFITEKLDPNKVAELVLFCSIYDKNLKKEYQIWTVAEEYPKLKIKFNPENLEVTLNEIDEAKLIKKNIIPFKNFTIN